jgi:spore germination cell wall hydrolase CwlJ-like protein
MIQNDGRRDVVNDPLAVTGREVRPDRSLALSGVRSPNNGGPVGAGDTAAQVSSALGSLQNARAQYIEKKKDDWRTEGKMAYMAGKTEADLLANGNRFTHQGFLQLKVRDDVNNWYMQEAADIDTASRTMDPAAYQDYLKSKRQEVLKGITDPYAQKVATAAFEDFAPKLVQSQFAKNNEFQREQRVNGFMDVIGSTASTSASRSVVDENTPLALSPSAVEPVMQVSERDRDIAIRTIIGEAGREGAIGQAAVAHVLRNRAVDGRWPSSIAGVALQNKQFSAWNSGAGGNNGVKVGPGNAIYERVGKVFDAVMSGRHVDPTGGATHYYSPAGMNKLVADGDQSNVIPRWLAGQAKESGGTVRIGGHVFAGKSRGASGARASVSASAPALSPEEQMSVKPELSFNEQGELVRDLNTVAADEGVNVTGVQTPGAKNEVQELIRGYAGLNPADKATAVASKMQQQLQSGDNTLYRDAGGVAILRELGASPSEIAAVEKAAAAYDKDQLDKYDADDEAWRAGILEEASKTGDIDTIRQKIGERVASKDISDNEAQSLARQAATEIEQAKAKQKITDQQALNGNIAYQRELGGLYQQISSGDLSFEDAGLQAKEIAKIYGASEQEVGQVIGQMFSLDQQRKNSVRAQAEQLAIQTNKDNLKKSEVTQAIARGTGLKLLDGQIVGTGESQQEYGVEVIKQKHIAEWNKKVEAGEVDQATAVAGAIRGYSIELQKQGVIDKKWQTQTVGALVGAIRAKDGTLNEDALQAYDAYKIMRDTPEISDGFIAQQVGDDKVRALLETAYKLDGGNNTGGIALGRADEILHDTLRDPNDTIPRDAIWQRQFDKGIKAVIDAKSNPGFWSRLFGNRAPEGETDRAMKNKDRAGTYVQNRADVIYLQNPNIDPEVALKMATDDLEQHSTVIAGNLIVTPEQPLAEAMGISQFGTDAPDKAVTEYIRKYGERIWGDEYTERKRSLYGENVTYGIGSSMTMGIPNMPQPLATVDDPPMRITYDRGLITVQLYKDEAKGILLGEPRRFKADAIGQEFYDSQTKLTGWDDMWNSIRTELGAGAKALGEQAGRQQIMELIAPK